jgi:sporulation protein YlmC with PRC-barrel domain
MRWSKTSPIMIALFTVLLVTVSAAQVNGKNATMYRASKLMGTAVENPQGEHLGTIKDVVLDLATGRSAYVILGFGGFLGRHEKYCAIPWTALMPKAGTKAAVDRFVLNIDKDELKNAPGFDRNTWPDMDDHQWGAQVHAYYGLPPYWEQREARVQGSAISNGEGAQRDVVVSATVQDVDQASRLLGIRTSNHEIIELLVPAGLLNQLQAGDSVEVVIHQQNVTTPSTTGQPTPDKAGQPGR